MELRQGLRASQHGPRRGGALSGAYLDVFAHEPLPADSPLWDLPDVVVTPHAAGHSDGNEARVAGIFPDNPRRWVRGEALLNRVA
jgi:phosphoglycerate dehydrogenase-like enzyme